MFFALARSPPASRRRDGSPRVFAGPLLHPHYYLGFQPRFGAFSDASASRESSLPLHSPDGRASERHKRFQFLESNVSHIRPFRLLAKAGASPQFPMLFFPVGSVHLCSTFPPSLEL